MVAAGLVERPAGSRSPPWSVSMVLFSIGLLICGSAPSMEVLVGGRRLVQGLGGGALTVGLYVLVGLVFAGPSCSRASSRASPPRGCCPALFGPGPGCLRRGTPSAGAGCSFRRRHLRGCRGAADRAVPATRQEDRHRRLRGRAAPAAAGLGRPRGGRGAGPRAARVRRLGGLGAALRRAGRGRGGSASGCVPRGQPGRRPRAAGGDRDPWPAAPRGSSARRPTSSSCCRSSRDHSPGQAGIALTRGRPGLGGASQVQGRLGATGGPRRGRCESATVVWCWPALAAAVHRLWLDLPGRPGERDVRPRLAPGWASATRAPAWRCSTSSTDADRGSNSAALSIADSLGAALALSISGVVFAAAERAGRQSVPCRVRLRGRARAGRRLSPRAGPRPYLRESDRAARARSSRGPRRR